MVAAEIKNVYLSYIIDYTRTPAQRTETCAVSPAAPDACVYYRAEQLQFVRLLVCTLPWPRICLAR